MAQIWITSDSHFGHRNMAEVFTQPDGMPMRPFGTLAATDAAMVERWNAVVKPQDHVWHLGDFAMNKWALDHFCPLLHGHKRLVRGNHDIFKTQAYLRAGFEELRGVSVIDGLIFTHIPIHPNSLGRFRANVHGHTHAQPDYDWRYLNVSVERTDYTPLALEDVDARVRAKCINENPAP